MAAGDRDARKLALVRIEGPTSISVDAEVRAGDGALVLSGQDVGEGPSSVFGDSDYEYWLTVRAEHKDALLLVLLEQAFGGDGMVVSRLRALLDAKGVPCEFFSYS